MIHAKLSLAVNRIVMSFTFTVMLIIAQCHRDDHKVLMLRPLFALARCRNLKLFCLFILRFAIAHFSNPLRNEWKLLEYLSWIFILPVYREADAARSLKKQMNTSLELEDRWQIEHQQCWFNMFPCVVQRASVSLKWLLVRNEVSG